MSARRLRHKAFPPRLFCYAVRSERRRQASLPHGRRAPDGVEQFAVQRVRVAALRQRAIAAGDDRLVQGDPELGFLPRQLLLGLLALGDVGEDGGRRSSRAIEESRKVAGIDISESEPAGV